MLVQQAFQMKAVRQYVNSCYFVAKQAFLPNRLLLVAPKRFQIFVAKHSLCLYNKTQHFFFHFVFSLFLST